jgi:hypothetical protein
MTLVRVTAFGSQTCVQPASQDISDLYKSKNKDMVGVLELDFYKTKSTVNQVQIFPDALLLSLLLSLERAISGIVEMSPKMNLMLIVSEVR